MAGTIWICALIGFVVGFIPFGSFLLIPLEAFLLYKIMDYYHAFDLWVFFGVFAVLGTLSLLLKALATFAHALPVVGQIANSLVACGFILIFGFLADKHYYEHSQQAPKTTFNRNAHISQTRELLRSDPRQFSAQ